MAKIKGILFDIDNTLITEEKKPDPKGFPRATKKMNLKPDEVMMVGVRPEQTCS